MKKSYTKILILEVIILFLLLLNGFIKSLFNIYTLILIIFGALILFKFTLGFERSKKRYVKDIILELIIMLIVILLLYYISGLLLGFKNPGNYYTWYGLKTFILPLIIYTILKEIFRYNLLRKCEYTKGLTILTIIMFILLDIEASTNLNSILYVDKGNVFLMFAMYIIPAIFNNIVASYISFKVGYKPNILWFLTLGLYKYLLPIVPNYPDFLISVSRIIIPVVLFLKVYLFFDKASDKDVVRNYKKKDWISMVICIFIVSTLIYFVSGYFSYYAIAIGSGSMYPTLKTGDVVIVKKTKDIKENDVIAYRYSGVMVIHRLVEKTSYNNELIYYSKGDNNNDIDSYMISEDMISGKVIFKIPYIGFPTVWLSR